MEKNIRKLLSVVLVLVMLFNMIPLNAFAAETTTQPPANTTGHEAVPHDVYIVEEIIEERSEYIKQFRMSNGLQMAAVYASPVHYEENGRWEEIDNTLQLATTRSGNAYVNTAGVWQVSFPQNMTEDNGITITKDGHVFIFRMAGELLDPDFQDIIVESEIIEIPAATEEASAVEETIPTEDETTVTETEATVETEQKATETTSEDTTEEQTAAIQETVEPQDEQENETADENLAIVSTPDESVVAEVAEIDTEAAMGDVEFPETVVDKINSRLSYEEIYEDTDIIFDLKSNQVKESIVMKEYRDALKGYIYTLEVGDMIPVLKETGEIELRSADGEEVIMYMPAPYLIDDADATCFDIDVSLEGENGKYILAYELPQEWLSSEDRQWPVVLDPAVQPTLDTNNIRDRTVSAVGGFSNEAGSIQCGYFGSNKVARIYVKYTNLPVLTSADMIVSANMRMYSMYTNYNSSKSVPVVEVHKVKGVWESQTITWANKPDYDPTVEDYAVVSAKETFYNWDVTDLVQEWYEGENTGMMFKMPDSVEAAADVYSQFYSSDYSYYQVSEKPTLTIIFRNNNGLEGYWDYTTSSAGRAGTGYVNQYTGNLVWTRSDIGFGGNRMPVTISHVYNTNDSTENQFGMGNGWRTNFNQMVYHWDNQNAYGDYYVWEDSDGTDHYFYYESAGTYKDEDGLELTLTTTGSGTEKYCITDKNGNASYFDTYGRLTKQSNNQATKSSITITYTTTSGKLISTITDGAGRVYAFTYANNLLSKIAYKGKGTTEITYVNFGYTNSNLTSVTDKDGKTCSYTYTTNNLLDTAQDIDGYKICYDYTTGQPSRVMAIEEYSGTTAGGVLSIEYAHNQTKFTDYNGNVQIVQFNNMGNTISIQDDQGRAQYAQYAINDPQKKEDTAPASVARSASTAKGNQLLLASKLQNTVGNILKDSNFETGIAWTSSNSTYASCAVVSDASYLGSKSLKITHVDSTVEAGAYSPAFTIQPGETYTLSGYVKTGAATAYLAIGSSSAGYHRGESIPVNQDWTRVEYSYTNNTTAAQSVHAFFLTTGAGTTYVDCVQVEKAPTASRYNLIENGDFAYSDYAWNTSTGRTTVTADNKAPAPQLDINVYKMTGNPTGQNRISQTVKVSGTDGDTFVLAGWAKADSVPIKDDREFALIATFKNGTTIVNTSIVRFNYCADSTIEWQYAASPIVAKGAFDSLVIELAYDYNANTVYFDGVQLYKEEFGNSYTYDEDGNIISVKDVQSQTTSYEYEDNDLTAQVLPSGARLEYEYDEWHNVVKATSDTGVVYNFVYDAYGNNTSVSIVSGSVTLTSSADYTDDGNRLETTTDAAGKVTTYSYNENTNVLEWVRYPKDTASTWNDDGTINEQGNETFYTYDDMYRLATTSTKVSTGDTLIAAYEYENDLLQSIATASTTYSFNYGDFALRSNIMIGNWTLASYSYTARNNFLDTLAYGNGDSVKYTYDKQGRVTKQTYEDGDTVIYKYDNSGALASVTDSATGITTTYYYDYTDRLLRYAEKGSDFSHIVGYEYDNVNNLTQLVNTINNSVLTSAYTYDKDNRVVNLLNTLLVNGSEVAKVSAGYTYDAFGRLSEKTVKKNDINILTVGYEFVEPTENVTTSGQVSALKLNENGDDFSRTYAYTYDDNGNILSVSDGVHTTTYVYDSANQLIRENNQAAGKTWVWTYDNAGNIQDKTEYDYTLADAPTGGTTVVYSYGDEDWGDLLKGYNNHTIDYDEIGNPVTVKNSAGEVVLEFQWEHGRQLVGLHGVDMNGEENDVTVSYTYNADGIRTGKTVTTKNYVSHVHNYTSTVVAPTCEEAGYTLHECSCGDSYQDAETVALGHSYTSTVIPPSGSTPGYTRYTCTRCGYTYSSHTHTYTAGQVVAPTCTQQGYTLYSCLCGAQTKRDYVAALGHDFTSGMGLNGRTCKRCGAPWGGVNPPITPIVPPGSGEIMGDGGSENMTGSAEIMNVSATDERTLESTIVTKYDYIYTGTQLTQMIVTTTVDDEVPTTETLYFTYETSGPMTVTYNGETYYYAANLQGDVVAILDDSGDAVVEYTYDAWGKLLTTSGDLADTLGETNPLTYRGYVYDTETTLYYLQSRYYDPEMGRFVNADTLVSTKHEGLGCNVFSYCFNNPTNYIDDNGFDAIWIQEESNVGTMGHSGLLIQDEETGKWYYFFWGAPTSSTGDPMVFGPGRAYYLIEVESDGYDFSNTEDVTRAVEEALSGVEGISGDFVDTRTKITATVYFEGDYSLTYSYLVGLADLGVNTRVDYNLIVANCGQISWTAMSKSDSRFRETPCAIIPNIAYLRVLRISQMLLDE